MQKILLLHGALGSAAHFDTLKELLSEDFEIHTINFAGHGRTDSATSLAIPLFAEAVLDYLDRNRMETISIFGYSMGGYVGLYLARHYPKRIEKLFALATKLHWTPESAAKESAMLNPDKIREKVPKYAAALEQLHGADWPKLLGQTAQLMLGLGNDPALKAADFEQIQKPVQLAVGDKDSMVSLEETIAVYRLLPNAQLLVLPNTIHPIEKVGQEELAYQIRKYFL